MKEQLGGCSIYFVGMMGAGKTTLANMLSATIKYCPLDLDDLVCNPPSLPSPSPPHSPDVSPGARAPRPIPASRQCLRLVLMASPSLFSSRRNVTGIWIPDVAVNRCSTSYQIRRSLLARQVFSAWLASGTLLPCTWHPPSHLTSSHTWMWWCMFDYPRCWWLDATIQV